MNKNKLQQCWCRMGRYGCLAACLATLHVGSRADPAVGRAHATVVEPVSVRITATPSLSSTVTSVESASERASSGAPVLLFHSPPSAASGAATTATATDTATNADHSPATAAAPAAEASTSPDVKVTVKADGSLSISPAGNGITFSVNQPESGPVTIEYN